MCFFICRLKIKKDLKKDQSSECERTEHSIFAQITGAALNQSVQAYLEHCALQRTDISFNATLAPVNLASGENWPVESIPDSHDVQDYNLA